MRHAFEMNSSDRRYRFALINDSKLKGMNGAIGSVAKERHHDLRGQLMSKEGNIKHLDGCLTLPRPLFGDIGRSMPVIRTLSAASMGDQQGIALAKSID